jgi:[acyl-carrier-protein] S-malonyltransferase
VANFNDAGQTVISGSKAAVEKACECSRPMARSVPCLCRSLRLFTQPDATGSREAARATCRRDDLQRPGSLINNIDVRVETSPDRIRDALYRQAFGPCAGSSASRRSRRAACDDVECGPGKVLAGMVSAH